MCGLAPNPNGSSESFSSRISSLAKQKSAWKPCWRGILHRLVGDDASAFLGVSPDVSVVLGPVPNAYATDRSKVVISSGLLQIVDSPSELAFVMAHELGHLVLSHHGTKYLGTDKRALSSEIEEELAADRIAIQLLREGGFDPAAGRSVLDKLKNYGFEKGIRLQETYPSLTVRFNAMNVELARLEHSLIEAPKA